MTRQRLLMSVLGSMFTFIIAVPGAVGQPFFISEEEQVVADCRAVLSEIAAAPEQGIPRALMSNASGIAIIPNVLKGGFVVGVRRGHGVVLLRDPNGAWTLPQFVTLTGGSFGWQAGVQSTDLILVFKTPNSIRGLLSGKMTIGADAAAAAGPVGRNAAVATDGQLKAEIFSYSRSRGLFAGVALDGSSLQINQLSTAKYYQAPAAVVGQPAAAPATALALVQEVNNLAPILPGAALTPMGNAPVPPPNVPSLRQQMVIAAGQLQALLDPNWRNYLALPAEVMAPGPINDMRGVAETLGRFDTVAGDPRYAAISTRIEFQNMHQLLRQVLAAEKNIVVLPPPPQ